jgi:catechol 2,3-dioxygenase-like lactoylglutathione lyase family enzyme
MKLLRLEHLDIVCSDVKKSVEFYRKLGLAPEGTLDKGAVVFMFSGDDGSPVRVELHQAEKGQKTGINHVAFEVSDTDAAYREGKYVGLDFKMEPLQNRQSGRRIVNLLDPDGVEIQLARKTLPGEYGNWG